MICGIAPVTNPGWEPAGPVNRWSDDAGTFAQQLPQHGLVTNTVYLWPWPDCLKYTDWTVIDNFAELGIMLLHEFALLGSVNKSISFEKGVFYD